MVECNGDGCTEPRAWNDVASKRNSDGYCCVFRLAAHTDRVMHAEGHSLLPFSHVVGRPRLQKKGGRLPTSTNKNGPHKVGR